MKKYYLHDGANQSGPFDKEELKLKNIKKTTAIWYEGLTEWTTAGQIAELQDVIGAIPPPFAAAAPPPLQSISVQQPSYTTEKKKGNGFSKALTTIGILILLGLGINYLYNLNIGSEEENRKAEYRNNITNYVIADRSDYQYSNLGGIYNLQISVSNNTEYLIDKVIVRIFYYKPNGEVWDTRDVEFTMLEGSHKYTLKIPDTNRGVKVDYEIIAIKSSVLGLN